VIYNTEVFEVSDVQRFREAMETFLLGGIAESAYESWSGKNL
jgi:hypothetical protein